MSQPQQQPQQQVKNLDFYELFYFNERNCAELIRLILIQTKQQWKDTRLTQDQWNKMKEEPKVKGMQLPLLNSKAYNNTISQSKAIARLLAEENNLHSTNEWECYLIDRAIEQMRDILRILRHIHFDKERLTKSEEVFKMKKGVEMVKVLMRFVKEDGIVGRSFALTKRITWAELFFTHLCDTMKVLVPNTFEQLTELNEMYCNILKRAPLVAEWIRNRPVTPI